MMLFPLTTCFWPIYPTYHIHIIYYSALYVIKITAFLETYIPKVDMAMMMWWMIWYCYSFLFGFKCTFQLYTSGFSISWYGYRYHVTLSIGELHPTTVYRTVFGCELFCSWVSSCVPFTISLIQFHFILIFITVIVSTATLFILWLHV